MAKRNRTGNRTPNDEIQEFRGWDIEFRSNYRGPCLLKDSDPATPCNVRSWNHIVGEKFLSLIAPRDKVLYWDIFSGKMLAIQSMIMGKLGRRLVDEITDFKPDPIGIVNDPRCQIKGACNYHDNKAFERIETPLLFDPNIKQHQLTIGMRAAFAEAAFLSNSKQWLAAMVRGKPKALQVEYYKVHNAQGRSLTRLQQWMDIVQRNAIAEVKTTHWTERLPITIAACGTSNRDKNHSAPTINVMPRTDGQVDILISTRYDSTNKQDEWDDAETERLKNVIKAVKNDPATGIETLIRTIEQVFLNPNEFNDDSIITENERIALKEGIARYRAEEFARINGPAKIPFGRRQ